MARAYLDAASAAPLRPAALAAMREALEVAQADPGRSYAEGLRTRDLLESARQQVAAFVVARPSQVTFTSGLPEIAATVMAHGRARRPGPVVLSSVERSAIHDAAVAGGDVVILPVDPGGQVDQEALEVVLGAQPALLALQWANQETGVLQDLEALLGAAQRHGVPTLLDATTAAGHLPIDATALGATFLAVSAEGFGGPVGIAAVVVGRGVVLQPLLRGGAQERGRRAGLEPLVLAAGMGAAAAVLTPDELTAEAERARHLMAGLEAAATAVEGVEVVGGRGSVHRAPHLLCCTIVGVEAEAVVVGLDRRGVAVHSGAACAAETIEESPVLAAMGLDAAHSLRCSVSWATTGAEVARFAEAFSPTVADLHRLGSQLR